MKNRIILLAALSILAVGCVKQETTVINQSGNNNGTPIDSTKIHKSPVDSILSITIGETTLGENDINGSATTDIKKRRVLSTHYQTNPFTVNYVLAGKYAAEMVVEVRDYAYNTTLVSRAYNNNIFDNTPTGSLTLGAVIPKGLYVLTITMVGTSNKSFVYPFQVF